MSFASLKKNRTNSFDKLNSQLQSMSNQKMSKGDDNYWKPEVDKAGNGYAVLRFLPASENEDMPFVRYWDHGFQGPGGWYIEKSLTTLSQDDPVSEYNSQLWNSGHDEDKEIARKQKRRLSYVANVMVVSDPSNPSREGQVYLYKFGKKIFDKLNDAMNPQFADEDPINPFDFWEGADFKLKIRQVEGYRNYDKSEFAAPSPVAADDAEIEAIWAKQHSLAKIIDPSNFKSYDELKKKLDFVLGASSRVGTAESISAVTGDSSDDDFLKDVTAAVESRKVVDTSDEDDTMSYFAKLAQDD